MSNLADIAAMILVSPAVQDQARSYTVTHLCEQAVKAAVAIKKSKPKADAHLVAMLFGAQHGSTLAQLGDSQIQAAVESANKSVEILEEVARVAELDEVQETEVEQPEVISETGSSEPSQPESQEPELKPEPELQSQPEIKVGSDPLLTAVADMAMPAAYKKALIAANLNTAGDILAYDKANEAEGGLEKLEGIGKVARERILDFVKAIQG